MVRVNSYKNHLAAIYKNEDGRNFILDFCGFCGMKVRSLFGFYYLTARFWLV